MFVIALFYFFCIKFESETLIFYYFNIIFDSNISKTLILYFLNIYTQLYYLIIASTLIFAFNNKLILLLLFMLYLITFFLELISSTIDYNIDFNIIVSKKNQNCNLYINTFFFYNFDILFDASYNSIILST